MSENREPALAPDEKIRVWSCPIERFAIALCKVATRVSMACSLSVYLQPEFIAGRFVRHARRNSSIAVFSGLLQRHRKPGFGRAFVAVLKLLPIWPAGAEPRILFPAPWL